MVRPYIQREKKISPRIWNVNLILWWFFFTSDIRSLNRQLDIKTLKTKMTPETPDHLQTADPLWISLQG